MTESERQESGGPIKETLQEELILFFIKYPEPGRVKTRLAAKMGMEGAAELYGNFILDGIETIESSGLSFRICFIPAQKRASLISWLGAKYPYRPQRGRELGERMKWAFDEAFSEGYKRVVLMGSDFPDLPGSFLKESMDALLTRGAVMGPAVDGGYYLIGFRAGAFVPAIFEGMTWGKKDVSRKTLSILKEHNQQTYILPPWNDVDTIEDLHRLMRRAQGTDFSSSRTMAFLASLKIPF